MEVVLLLAGIILGMTLAYLAFSGEFAWHKRVLVRKEKVMNGEMKKLQAELDYYRRQENCIK